MARELSILVILCTLSIVKATYADGGGVSCALIGYGVYGGTGENECIQQEGCRLIKPDNSFENSHFCVPVCNQFETQAMCDNYAGCKWFSGDEWTSPGCDYIRDNKYRYWRTQVSQFVEGDCTVDNNGQFPLAPIGADDPGLCYKMCAQGSDPGADECGIYTTANGGSFFLGILVSCPLPNETILFPGDEFHEEPESKCRLNNRPCNMFIGKISGQTINDTENIGGYATWSRSNHSYDTTNCTYRNTTPTIDSNLHCYKKSVYTSTTNSVSGADGIIEYSMNGQNSSYYCTQCAPDNGNNKYYASSENGVGCTANLSNGVVCKCETSTHHGHYRKGNCCESNTDCPAWTNANGQVQIDNICTRVACDIPGTTTEDLLPTSNNNSVCVYGPLTEMHDSMGDFKLQEIPGGPDPYGWEKIY